MSTQTPKGLLATNQPDLFFEDTAVGRLKKEIWEASDAQIDAWLAEVKKKGSALIIDDLVFNGDALDLALTAELDRQGHATERVGILAERPHHGGGHNNTAHDPVLFDAGGKRGHD